MNHKVVIVLALLRAGVIPHTADAGVRGGYIVSFNATKVAESHFANAALDAFHRGVPVMERGSFDFFVLDPRKHHRDLTQGDAYPGEYRGSGDIDGPHVADWKVAVFRVHATGGAHGARRDLGTVAVGGVNLIEMAEEARAILWDESLRTQGMHPQVEWVRNCGAWRAENDEHAASEEKHTVQERAQ